MSKKNERPEHPAVYKVDRISGDFLLGRPEGMDFEKYKELRKSQHRSIKRRLQHGYCVWKSRAVLPMKGYEGAGYGKLENWGELRGKVPVIQIV